MRAAERLEIAGVRVSAKLLGEYPRPIIEQAVQQLQAQEAQLRARSGRLPRPALYLQRACAELAAAERRRGAALAELPGQARRCTRRCHRPIGPSEVLAERLKELAYHLGFIHERVREEKGLLWANFARALVAREAACSERRCFRCLGRVPDARTIDNVLIHEFVRLIEDCPPGPPTTQTTLGGDLRCAGALATRIGSALKTAAEDGRLVSFEAVLAGGVFEELRQVEQELERQAAISDREASVTPAAAGGAQ